MRPAPRQTSLRTKWNQRPLTLVSNGVSDMAYGSYDALGRVTSSTQTFGVKESIYSFSYGYNFLALKNETYPSQRQVSCVQSGPKLPRKHTRAWRPAPQRAG